MVPTVEAAPSNTAEADHETDMEMIMEAVAHQRRLGRRSMQHILGTTHKPATLMLAIMEGETILTAEAVETIPTVETIPMVEVVEAIRTAVTVAAKEVQWTGDQYKAHGETFDLGALRSLRISIAHYPFTFKSFPAEACFRCFLLFVIHISHVQSYLRRLRLTFLGLYLLVLTAYT